MVLKYCVAHRIPYVISGGLDGEVFPAGCFALLGFATDNISNDPARMGAALLSLCAARTGVPKRTAAAEIRNWNHEPNKYNNINKSNSAPSTAKKNTDINNNTNNQPQ